MKDVRTEAPWRAEKRRRILEAGFRLFSQRGIEPVTMPEVAQEGGVARATLYRYYATKLDLVIAIGAWKWEEYIEARTALLTTEDIEQLSASEHLRFYLDAFLDLYRNHSDILRFNYSFNSFLRTEQGRPEQRQPYMRMVDALSAQFHAMYVRGLRDGTLNTDIPETAMFSSSFHIMLAAVTRYAVGLVYVPEQGADPESELIMLEELLLAKYCGQEGQRKNRNDR